MLKALMLAVWIFAMMIFLGVPILANRERRAIWWRRLRYCRWFVDTRQSQEHHQAETQSRSTSATEDCHYVVSTAQEEEIRESFLVELVRNYTKTLVNATNPHVCMVEPTANKTANIASSSFESVLPSPELTVDASLVADVDVDVEKGHNEPDEATDIFEEGPSLLSSFRVPIPGQSVESRSLDNDENVLAEREVLNGCTICLSAFEPGDRITWSSNPDCTHVFHHDCVLDWLMASGRKHLRRQHNSRSNIINYTGDPIQRITNFPMPCPCCRQDFITKENALYSGPPNKEGSTSSELSQDGQESDGMNIDDIESPSDSPHEVVARLDDRL